MPVSVGEQTAWGTVAHMEPDVEKVLREVSMCGYREYASAIAACDSKLSARPSEAERKLLQTLRGRWDGQMTTLWSKTLLFGDIAKGLSKSEMAALVRLVRRGLVKVSVVFLEGTDAEGRAVGGRRHLWEFSEA